MTDRRTSVKLAILLAPLILSVLALHAWGDGMAGGLSRAAGGWQYPVRNHAIFHIRVPRRSDADAFAANALHKFVADAVKTHGSELGLATPTEPINVVLLDPETDARRYRWPAAAQDLKANTGMYDAAGRTIYVRMHRELQRDEVIAALRETAARALLHDAGSASWSPWLAEGLVGRLEGARPAALRSQSAAALPTLSDVLALKPADFHGYNAPLNARAAKLLVAFLMDARSSEFIIYYDAVREKLPVPDSLFANPVALEAEWKKWIQDQK